MNPYEKIEIKKEKGKEIWLLCNSCEKETCHEIFVSVYTFNENNDARESCEEQYRIVQCKGCKSISFLKEYQNSESGDYDENNQWQMNNYQEIYPAPVSGRKTMDVFYLPFQISQIYKESLTALNNQLPILTGIGIRAIVETVCKQLGSKGKNLPNKINDLLQRSIITPTQAEFLHELRILGNEAAHEVVPYNENILITAISLVENLLQNVYLIPEVAKELKKRKND
jgi:hypothetical protein